MPTRAQLDAALAARVGPAFAQLAALTALAQQGGGSLAASAHALIPRSRTIKWDDYEKIQEYGVQLSTTLQQKRDAVRRQWGYGSATLGSGVLAIRGRNAYGYPGPWCADEPEF
jgi:hypothetical protein